MMDDFLRRIPENSLRGWDLSGGLFMVQPVRGRRAFTLIELLVVIAIIAILVSLLLRRWPAPGSPARALKCSINFRSIGQGFSMYANDFKERIWEAGNTTPYRFWYAQPTDPTLGLSAANPAQLGPAFQYLSIVDRVFECPTSKRKAQTHVHGRPQRPLLADAPELPADHPLERVLRGAVA